jgi:hypothetical protein
LYDQSITRLVKIRIRENSIRFRLSKSEVDAFERDGHLENKTEFGFADFVYGIQILDGIDSLAATYIGNKMTLFVPLSMRKEWTTTDMVGYNGTMNIGPGKTLNLLLEKDWACIDKSDEDQNDSFPNPNLAC